MPAQAWRGKLDGKVVPDLWSGIPGRSYDCHYHAEHVAAMMFVGESMQGWIAKRGHTPWLRGAGVRKTLVPWWSSGPPTGAR